MASKSTEQQRDIPVASEKKLDDLYDLIDGIEVAMMTTRRPDGHLVSRPMQMQARDPIADIWFVTNIESHKLDELEFDPHINLAFYRDRTGEWVSLSGTARITQARELIRELYKSDWKAWFGDEGGARDGSPDDPRLALILVEAHSVTYMKSTRSQPLVLFDVLKGMVTGSRPDVGEVRHLEGNELRE